MKNFSYAVWLLFSVVMIVSGVFGCFMPLETFMGLAVLLPVFLLVGGLSNVIYYFYARRVSGAEFILIDGLLNLLFAWIFFYNGIDFTSQVIVIFVAFMILFKGILGIGYALKLKKLGLEWLIVFIFAFLNIIVAMIFIVNPTIGSVTIGFMIALMVLFFGIISFWFGLSSKKLFDL
ncbi:HdeD family acid-resistance protein [Helicobacter canadensis]|uniref:Acid-resistance membrane protein n=1 Tax=Helicobacter canadensis MIT 98-5491 TaxID=537970 RepID=C5ZW94_9HELI|nr:DUF308 domain-containing protein [Helicobacter canadensis]EES89412.1 hypothetical protein HCAN_0698 [Helicobacter canadensis MIT 98-5491]EFR48203.1 hypothetical protein HCMG_00376 [Helicobacter canadensis MIT 98-5491]STO99450.1 acid-resistance membrane protein [Helicobacter canadensis]